MKKSPDTEYVPAANRSNNFLDNFVVPRPAGVERTLFTNLRRRPVIGTVSDTKIDAVALFQTHNGRYWSLVEAGVTSSPDGPGMTFTTYAGVRSNAAAILAGGNPARSSSWQKHNLISTPPSTSEAYGSIMDLGAALAIMHTNGDVGEEGLPLRPVQITQEYPPEPPNGRITGFKSRHLTHAAPVTIYTAHLRSDTTSIAAGNTKGEAVIDMSMFGRPSLNTTVYLESLIAATAIYMGAQQK